MSTPYIPASGPQPDMPALFRHSRIVTLGYRWSMWIVAGLLLAVQGEEVPNLPVQALMLLCSGLGMIVLTNMIEAFLPHLVANVRWLLGDVALSALLLTVVGGEALPFGPFALGALILPTLLRGLYNGLFAAALFVMIDSLAFLVAPTSAALVAQLGQTLLAFAFVLLVFAGYALYRRIIGSTDQLDLLKGAPVAPQRMAFRSQAVRAPVRRTLDTGGWRDLDGTPLNAPTPLAQLAQPLALGRDQKANPRLSPPANPVAPPKPLAPQPSATLTPPPSLPQLLREMAESYASLASLRIYCSIATDLPELPLPIHELARDIAKAALENVVRHSRAASVLVSLHTQNHQLTLVVQDDGVGLLDGTHERPGMHTLRALSYRAAEHDGTIEVEEIASGGVKLTALIATVPPTLSLPA